MEGLATAQVITLGRYALHGEIAAGGMATVYFGRLIGPVGFSRIVAVKRMHPHYARDPEFVAMFLDEAQLAARIQHPNVVATLDVVAEDGEIFIVMEYVRGESLAALLRASRRRREPVPVGVVATVMVGALAGLHAAHEANDESGELLNIVHRDVSPQNVLVGQDGLARLVDFGVAKATSRLQVTRGDQLKGKVCYMAPEQLEAGSKIIDRSTDLFAAGAVLWELLAGRRLFQGDDAGRTIAQVLACQIPPLSAFRDDVPPALEDVVRQALQRDPADRFATAEDFGAAIEAAVPSMASARVVGDWVRVLAADVLAHREARVAELESVSRPSSPGSDRLASIRPPGSNPPTPAPPSSPGSGPRSAPPSGVLAWQFGSTADTPRPGAGASSSAPPPPHVGPSPSEASVASVAVPAAMTSSRRLAGFAVAIGALAGLVILGVTIALFESRGRSAGAVGESLPASVVAPSAPVVPAGTPVPIPEPAPTEAAAEPPAPPASTPKAPAPSARSSSAPKKAEAPTVATSHAAARPSASSYLPDRP